MATATFQDTYGGATPVRLVQIGRKDRWIWESAPEAAYRYAGPCGYRPVPKERAIRNAQRDWRFSNVAVG